MFNKTPLFSILALLVVPLGASAATSSSQQADYEQVRKIALRDPKVRAAYAEADRKLEAKILQIDPSLTPYVRRRSSEETKPAVTRPAPKPESAPTRPFRRAHVVAKGETLGSIAIKYGVGIAALKSANHITDERKLAVGHVLAIPNK